MFRHERLPAAFLAGGIAALAVLAGCVREPGVATAPDHSAMDHGMDHAMDHGSGAHAEGHDHGSMAPAAAVAAPVAATPGQPAATLRPDALDAPAATSVLDARRSAEMAEEMRGHGGHVGHGGPGAHGTGTYRHLDAGRGPGAYEGSEEHTPGAGAHQHDQHDHDPATPPPSGQEGDPSHHQHEPPAAPAAAAVYTCPMHPEVASATPGKCPKCGMTLVERRKE